MGVDFIERVFDGHTFRMGHQIDNGDFLPNHNGFFVSISEKKKFLFPFVFAGEVVGHYFNETKRRDYTYIFFVKSNMLPRYLHILCREC